MKQKQTLGRLGEELASSFLESSGMRVIERNWRCSEAEADLIAMDGDVLVIVEVKTRSTDHFGDPEDSVDERKQLKMIEAAEAYLEESELDPEVRFDIVSVIFDSRSHLIKHIPSAF